MTTSSRRIHRWPLLLVVMVLALALSALAAHADEPPAEGGEGDTPPAEEVPPTVQGESSGEFAQYGGVWGSNEGEVTLVITDKTFKGSWPKGTLEGTIDENGIFHYSWVDVEGEKGKGMLLVNGERLTGRWGFGGSTNNGGDWVLYRTK